VSEPEDVRRRTDPDPAGANTFYLLLSQPEILSWLELSEQELVAWLAPVDRGEDDDEEPRAA
jgi:hypothetical protein